MNELTTSGTVLSDISYRSLNEYRRFYLSFSDLEIMHTRVHNLTWSHFRIIMREATPEGRLWYMKEAED